VSVTPLDRPLKVPTIGSITLRGQATLSSGQSASNLAYRWSITSGDASIGDAGLASSSPTLKNVVIDATKLTAGVSYTFRLTATYVCTQYAAFPLPFAAPMTRYIASMNKTRASINSSLSTPLCRQIWVYCRRRRMPKCINDPLCFPLALVSQGSLIGYGDISFSTNQPPLGGVYSVSPSTGPRLTSIKPPHPETIYRCLHPFMAPPDSLCPFPVRSRRQPLDTLYPLCKWVDG